MELNESEIKQLKETLLNADNQLDEIGLAWTHRIRKDIQLMIFMLQEKERLS